MSNPMMPNPQEIQARMAEMPADSQAAHKAMMKLLATKPEPIIDMLDRLGIVFERKTVDGESCMVIKWFDLMKGEKRNQEQGTYFRKVMEDIRKEKEAGAFDE